MRIMALDVGVRRIGVAISDPTGSMAQPLKVIDRQRNDAEIESIVELAEEFGVSEVVVGLPLTMMGEIGPQAEEVLEYIDKLKGRIKAPINTWDERLTTVSAERALVESDIRRKRRKQVVDKVAATLILQGYLDSKRSEEHKAEPR